MAEKTKMNRYESDVMALPPLRVVLGDVPSPDPERRRNSRDNQRSGRELETNVKKLIAHLQEERLHP